MEAVPIPLWGFGRIIVLDWYDRPVEALVSCARKNTWFHAWLVTWRPAADTHWYAVRPIADALGERLAREAVETNTSLRVDPPLLRPADRQQLSRSTTLFLVETTELEEPAVEAWIVDARLLEDRGRPVPIDVLAEETDSDMARVARIVGRTASSL